MYDCIIVGGGIAGLQAAIQLGRYNYKVLVIDAEDGRSNLCRAYNNLLGWPVGVSGSTLRELGSLHAERLGVKFVMDYVTEATAIDENQQFNLLTEKGIKYEAKRLLLATGVLDRIPGFPELRPCMGLSVYICPDCDGFEVKDQRTLVLGSGDSGAGMAITLHYWTKDIVYINHELTQISERKLAELQDKGITVMNQRIEKVMVRGEQLTGVQLQDQQTIEAGKAFVAFGGNKVRSGLAEQLGVKLMDNKHIMVDPRTKMTSVKNVWSAGDVTVHSEQVSIAMGDGAQAAIWMHKSLCNQQVRQLVSTN